ncbi:MAG: hypothetical protein ABSD74_07950 [Rhizomicrobium sp.]
MRERFDPFAAYIDLFSNLLAFVLMVGLIALAFGGAARQSRNACARAADDQNNLSALFADFQIPTRERRVGPNCEIRMVTKGWAKIAEKVRFVQFGVQSSKFCWETQQQGKTTGNSTEGCELDADSATYTAEQTATNAFCDHLGSLLKSWSSPTSETIRRLVITGHASEEWHNGDFSKCTYGQIQNLRTTPQSAASKDAELELICNFKLSLERAQSAFSYCYDTWADTPGGYDKDLLRRMMSHVTLQGDAFLDNDVSLAFNDSRDRRRITVSVFMPGAAVRGTHEP